jgi:hypothetical protein
MSGKTEGTGIGVAHVERPHALLGGSSADRWSNCPGSVALSKTLPDKEVGDAAKEGTFAHEALEVTLNSWLDHKIKGTDYAPCPTLTGEMREYVLQAVQVLWENVLEGSITDKAYGMETKLVIEKSLDMYGYIDFWCVYIDDKGKRAGIIYDFKYGFHNVQADKNPQLAFYAVALQEALKKKGKPLDYCRGIIYQPRVYAENPLKETKFTTTQLETWKKKFIKAGNEIIVEKKGSYKAGDWCMWCKAQAICKTYKANLAKTTSLKLLGEAEPVTGLWPSPDQVSDEEISKIVLHGDAIKKFVDTCREYATGRALDGKPIPNTKLIEGTSRRKWPENQEEVIRALAESTGLDEAAFCNFKLKGITETENIVAATRSKKEAKNLLDQLTEKSIPSIKLVAADDPRPEVSSSRNLLNNTEI